MLQRLGFPDARRHPALVTGIGIDALGSGVFIPVSVLYFLVTTDVGKTRVGLAMSLAAVMAVPFVLVAGGLVDRFGAKRIILAGNLIQAVAFVGYVFADTFWAIVAVETLAALGQSAFWSAYSNLVAASTEPGEREVWFGFLGALRNVGFAIGGLAAGAVVMIGTDRAFHALVLANAVSYLFAFAALTRVPAGGPVPRDAGVARPGWGMVLRDHPYLVLVTTNAAYALSTVSLNIAMPVYAIDVLRLPGWVSGALFTVNTIMVGLGQGLVVRRMSGHRRFRIIVLAFGMYAAGFLVLAASGTLPRAAAVAGVLVAVGIYTFGEMLGGPPLSASSVEAAPEELRGRYLAAYQLSWVVAGIVAPALYLTLLDHDRFSVWGALILIATVGASLVQSLGHRLPAVSARVTAA
ncbi:MAG: MFS transporter [Tetrasphaera jenkinsii]|nr:MFS transporter [Tetrasphaera jenkinsii]